MPQKPSLQKRSEDRPVCLLLKTCVTLVSSSTPCRGWIFHSSPVISLPQETCKPFYGRQGSEKDFQLQVEHVLSSSNLGWEPRWHQPWVTYWARFLENHACTSPVRDTRDKPEFFSFPLGFDRKQKDTDLTHHFFVKNIRVWHDLITSSFTSTSFLIIRNKIPLHFCVSSSLLCAPLSLYPWDFNHNYYSKFHLYLKSFFSCSLWSEITAIVYIKPDTHFSFALVRFLLLPCASVTAEVLSPHSSVSSSMQAWLPARRCMHLPLPVWIQPILQTHFKGQLLYEDFPDLLRGEQLLIFWLWVLLYYCFSVLLLFWRLDFNYSW